VPDVLVASGGSSIDGLAAALSRRLTPPADTADDHAVRAVVDATA
jgi:hypothetical protein